MERQIVVFEIEDGLYGLDIEVAREIIPVSTITPVPNTVSFVVGVFNLRGLIVPVINMRRRLGYQEVELSKSSRIIVLNTDNFIVGIIVDRVIEVSYVNFSELDHIPEELHGRGYVKGIIQDVQGLIAILDPKATLGWEEGKKGEEQHD